LQLLKFVCTLVLKVKMKFESLHKIISNTRHLRYLYFIDESYYGDKLLQLFNKNLNIWGGRYNP
jgi:hypothetical protein